MVNAPLSRTVQCVCAQGAWAVPWDTGQRRALYTPEPIPARHLEVYPRVPGRSAQLSREREHSHVRYSAGWRPRERAPQRARFID